MKRTALMTVLLFAGTVAYAQTQPVPPLALVSNTQANAQDSPLVQAAKRAAEARRKSGSKSIAVITDQSVTRSTAVLSTSSGSAEIPDFTSKNYPAAQSYPSSTPARAAVPSTMKTTDEYGALAAAYPRMPAPSQNQGSTLRTAENAGYAPPPTAQNSSNPRPQSPASSVTAPRAATNASQGPAQSQNAGPNRTPNP